MNKWIELKNKLPEQSGTYIIYAPSRDKRLPLITAVFYDEKYGWRLIDIWAKVITHWMYLPKKPCENKIINK